jgi:molybdate transport system substrate-binding protein
MSQPKSKSNRSDMIKILIMIIMIVGAAVFLYLYIPPVQSQKPAEEIRVFAAASLATSFQEIGLKFEEKYNAKVVFNFAGSNALSAQIISGVPADVFASANTKEMERVSNASLLAEESTVFARNLIVVLVSKSAAGSINSLTDVTKPGVRLVVADKAVPVGKYTDDVLSKIESAWGSVGQPGYQGEEYANFSAKVYSNVISYEPDVPKVVDKVVNGVADAGFAYSSDSVVQGEQVKTIDIPSEVNVIATYPIGVISTSNHMSLAQKFVDFVLSDEGQDSLANSGFRPP